MARAGHLLRAMFSVAAAFVLVFGGAVWVAREYPAAAENSTVFGTVTGIAVALAAAWIARLAGIPLSGGRRRAPRGVVLAESSNPISPELKRPTAQQETDYTNDRSMTMTCPHLERIERAMRSAGIPLKPTAQIVVKATCRIERRGLLRQYAPLEPVRYSEYFIAERSPEDIPVALLECMECKSRIDVLHPLETNLSTPWFPAPPPAPELVATHQIPTRAEASAIACSPSGRYAAIAAGEHRKPPYLAVWDVAGSKPLRELRAEGTIRSLAWSSDERLVAAGRGVLWAGGPGSRGPSLFVWDAWSGAEIVRCGGELFGVRGIAISPDGQWLLASGMSGETAAHGSTLDLWEIATGRLSRRLAQVEPDGAPSAPVFEGVAFSPDGAVAMAACSVYTMPPKVVRSNVRELPWWWNRGVRAWSVATGEEAATVQQYVPVNAIEVSRDGSRLFFAGMRLGLWNLASGGMVWSQQNRYKTAAASPDCKVIAGGRGYQVDNHGPYEDTGVELVDGFNGEVISVGAHHSPVGAVSVGQDGMVIAGGERGELRFWRWPTKAQG